MTSASTAWLSRCLPTGQERSTKAGGRAAAYIDERADPPQRAALVRVLRGELGGPWALFIKTYELASRIQPDST